MSVRLPRVAVYLMLIGTMLPIGCVGASRPFPLSRRAARPLVEHRMHKTVSNAQLTRLHRSSDGQHVATVIANSSKELTVDRCW